MRRLLLTLLLALSACEGFRPLVDTDLGSDLGEDVSDGGASDTDLAAVDLAGGGLDGATNPCGQLATLPCLPTSSRVIEVPTQASISAALAAVQTGDTVQVRGVTISPGNLTLPAYVTLRGCEGARLAATVRFGGLGGAVSGFSISGAIVANNTGIFEVTDNVFRATTTGLPAISARSIDALASADVTMRVERNVFSGRDVGIEVATRYDTMTHSVNLTSINNAFYNVTTPISANEGGLVGHVTLRVEHNTFVGFGSGIILTSIEAAPPQLVANVWSNGSTAVFGDSPFVLDAALIWMVGAQTGGVGASITGSFEQGDPQLLNPQTDDFHPAAGSPALTRIGSPLGVPNLDLYSCRRPALRALGAAEGR